jgi:hypothetical protein
MHGMPQCKRRCASAVWGEEKKVRAEKEMRAELETSGDPDEYTFGRGNS